jgi:hypothetical protein
MKTQLSTQPVLQNNKIVVTTTNQLLLEQSERYELFKQSYIDRGFLLQITFEDKNQKLLELLIQSNRDIKEMSYLPAKSVVCTASIVEVDDNGNEKVILSASADAGHDWTNSPYSSSETMAIKRLFDRIGIESILHEEELNEVQANLNSPETSQQSSIPLTGEMQIPKIPTRQELDAAEVKTDVEATVEAEVKTDVEATVEAEVKTDVEATDDSILDAIADSIEEDKAKDKVEATVDYDLGGKHSAVMDELHDLNVVNLDNEPLDTTVDASQEIDSEEEEFALEENHFPNDIPKPFHAKIRSKLELMHGDKWSDYIPKNQRDAMAFLKGEA